MSKTAHPPEYYRQKELEVFPHIPGMVDLLRSSQDTAADLAAKYPDAVFALMTANEILSGDREQNAITQDAYFAILRGENVTEVRNWHAKAMDKYLQQHKWDD